LPRLKRDLRDLARLTRRPVRQQALALEAGLSLLAIKAVLTVMPFERWSSSVKAGPSPWPDGPVDRRVAEIVWAVERVSRRFPETFTCLPRAIAVRAMMDRRGLGSTLEIGVARDPGGAFQAHAWVRRGEQVIVGRLPDLTRFTPLPAWPASASEPGKPLGARSK
jgi:hypothetical protein